MNWHGIVIAVACFAGIGIFHPIVIKAEYYFSKRCWPVFLVLAIVFLGASTMTRNVVISAVLGSLGCSCCWSIKELYDQEKRVERGWFPRNPKRGNKKETDEES